MTNKSQSRIVVKGDLLMRLRFAKKTTIQWLMSFMAVWNKRVDGFHTPFQTRLDDYMIFGGFHIGIQHHCQGPPLLPAKQNTQQFHQQTSHSHRINVYGIFTYIWAVLVDKCRVNIPYIDPTKMRFTLLKRHHHRQTIRCHHFFFWSVACQIFWLAADLQVRSLFFSHLSPWDFLGDFSSPQNSTGFWDVFCLSVWFREIWHCGWWIWGGGGGQS